MAPADADQAVARSPDNSSTHGHGVSIEHRAGGAEVMSPRRVLLWTDTSAQTPFETMRAILERRSEAIVDAVI
jgi:hypothetical protein